MRNVGDVHAHLPDAVAHLAHREGVVEVLGVGRVHREGRRVAEVAARGDLLGCDPGVDRGGGLLDLGFEAVGQFVFGQDGVHLRIVVAGQSQPLDQLAHGALASGLPVGDADDDLLAVADVGVVALREVDVHRHAARVGPYEDLVGADLGDAHIGLAVALDDAGDLALHTSVPSAVDDGNLDTVAVEGVGRVALIDEYILLEPLDADEDRARGGHVGDAFVMGQMLPRKAVLFTGALLDDALLEELSENLECLAATLLRGTARDRGELLE